MSIEPSKEMTLLYVILTGIILVLSVMVAITCLLCHHNHNIRHLQQEVMDSRRHNRRASHHKPRHQGKLDGDGYIAPRQVPHSMHAPGVCSPQPPMYLTSTNKPYENISLNSESGQSYESV